MRRIGLAVVLLACVLVTIAGHEDLDAVLVAWFAFLLYLALCSEPLRRVVPTAHVTRAIAGVYVVAALLCVGFLFTVPMVTYGGPGLPTASVLSRAVGVTSLSAHAASLSSDVSWTCFALALLATMTLWGQVARLARRSEWKAIDHAVGDGSFATGATLQEPLGTSVTRPAESRAVRLHKEQRQG